MRHYIITGKKFEGDISVFYRVGNFGKLDFSNTHLSLSQIGWFLKNLPVEESGLENFMKVLPDCICVEEDYHVTLEDFTREYPYKRNSHLLPPIWDKMKPADKIQAVERAKDYRRYCERNDWYKPKIAAKWLKDREYLNQWRNM